MATNTWTVNFQSNDVSTATDLKAAEAGRTHWITKLMVTCLTAGTNWFKIMDGSTELIGPITPANGIPVVYTYNKPQRCTIGNALRCKTKAAVDFHALIEGFTTD